MNGKMRFFNFDRYQPVPLPVKYAHFLFVCSCISCNLQQSNIMRIFQKIFIRYRAQHTNVPLIQIKHRFSVYFYPSRFSTLIDCKYNTYEFLCIFYGNDFLTHNAKLGFYCLLMLMARKMPPFKYNTVRLKGESVAWRIGR